MRAIEFFSGIGAFAEAARALPIDVIAAFDQSQAANTVYRANFGLTPRSRNLDSIEASELPEAGLWWMSPPCTPFSRRGQRRDDGDPRAASFLNLIGLIPACLPQMILVENVSGFAGSHVHERLVSVLNACAYQVYELDLCSTQFGTPMRRPRHFLVACRSGRERHTLTRTNGAQVGIAAAPGSAGFQPAGGLRSPEEPSKLSAASNHPASAIGTPATVNFRTENDVDPGSAGVRPGSERARCPRPQVKSTVLIGTPARAPLVPLSDFLDGETDTALLVPEATAARYGRAYDIVDPQQPEAIAICFTSGYYRCQKASGSMITLADGRLRRFSPDEIVRLLGFSHHFIFPEAVPLPARWRLAGNSVDVRAIRYLLGELLGIG